MPLIQRFETVICSLSHRMSSQRSARISDDRRGGRCASEYQSVVKWIGQGLQNVERLGWCKDDCPVVRDPLVEDADFVDAAHNSAHLRNLRTVVLETGLAGLSELAGNS